MTEGVAGKSRMPDAVAAIRDSGFAIWASAEAVAGIRERFDSVRIPVKGVRSVRVWGLQVDDERELPGLERTSVPDEELWEINLQAKDGSCYEVEAHLLVAAPPE